MLFFSSSISHWGQVGENLERGNSGLFYSCYLRKETICDAAVAGSIMTGGQLGVGGINLTRVRMPALPLTGYVILAVWSYDVTFVDHHSFLYTSSTVLGVKGRAVNRTYVPAFMLLTQRQILTKKTHDRLISVVRGAMNKCRCCMSTEEGALTVS